jgi:transcriptional regulator with XRE-family HTH domain
MLNLVHIGKKIEEKRKQLSMTQNDLAERLYVTRQAVSKWEMGKSLPSMDVFVAMTKLFDVTIDYLVDGSELKENDYATMFMQYPRESVIYHFLHSDHINQDVKHIFYLLSHSERRQILDQWLGKKVHIDLLSLWPMLSIEERTYLLGNILSKNMDHHLDKLYGMLSFEEKMMIKTKKENHRRII